MKTLLQRIVMIAVALGAVGWMVYIHLEAMRTRALLTRQLQEHRELLDTALLADTGTRQMLVNNTDAETIASWTSDTCLTAERNERYARIRARLKQDANACREAWSDIRSTFADAAEAPSEAALVNTARVLAQQCIISAQVTHVMITDHIAQAKDCNTSGPTETPWLQGATSSEILLKRPN